MSKRSFLRLKALCGYHAILAGRQSAGKLVKIQQHHRGLYVQLPTGSCSPACVVPDECIGSCLPELPCVLLAATVTVPRAENCLPGNTLQLARRPGTHRHCRR